MVEKSPEKEKQPEAPQKLTLAQKIHQAMATVHQDHIVDEHPASPSSVPGGRRRGRRHVGPPTNKTPHGFEH